MRDALFFVAVVLLPLLAAAQCPSGEIPDCNGNCYPASWVGDGVCDDGVSFPSDFMCSQFNWDEGDCGDCPDGLQEDCNGNCVPNSLLGNGVCNNTALANFACESFGWDGGDCAPTCPQGQFADCNGVCWDNEVLQFVNDWHCHSGEWLGIWWMQEFGALNLDCEAFDFDGGDCLVWGCTDVEAANYYEHATDDDGSCQYGECPPGTQDCMGSCVPQNWVGSNACALGPPEDLAEHLMEGAYPAFLEQVIQVGAKTRSLCVLPNGTTAFAATDAGFVRMDFDESGTCSNLQTVPAPSLYTAESTADGEFVWGSAYQSGSVQVLEVATHEVVATLPSGNLPLKLRRSHNGAWMACSNHDSNTVRVWDVETHEVVQTISVGIHPRNIAFSPDDALLYVSNWSSWTLGVYATDTWEQVAEVPVDYWPQAVWPTPDGDHVLVANFGFDHTYDHISVIRTSDWETIARLQTGAGPEDMMTLGDHGQYLYVSNWGMSCCFYTVNSPCCAQEINKGTATIIALPDFSSIVPPGTVPEEIPYLKSTLKTVALEGEYSFGMAATPDGSRVFISHMDGETVSVLGLGEYAAPGEACDNASVLTAPAFCFEGCTAGYGDDINEQCPFEALGGPDRVYRYDAVATDTVNLEMCGSEFDTKLYIYEGVCPESNSGQALYCNDDACGVNGWRSRLEGVVFEQDKTYFIVVDGYGATDAGNFTLCFEKECPADLNNDEVLGAQDLMIFLEGFGIQFQVEHLMSFVAQYGASCN
jgi:YVTN family beta-propeller protein